ncbi:MAG: VWA domain-containing protein [Patescibacteria group bacterium]|jgi:Ca-activated chloride channel family protein|nr:VWA domain-containing protein [Patescibacteria group bacterium]
MENEQMDGEQNEKPKIEKWWFLVTIILVLIIVGVVFSFSYFDKENNEKNDDINNNISSSTQVKDDEKKVAQKDLKDDWQYDNKEQGGVSKNVSGSSNLSFASPQVSESLDSSFGSPAPSNSNIGLAVGGAKDVNNFRENIKEDYLPLPTDISHEGLFYDYYFDTGSSSECEELFCPSYASAVSSDPISKEKEYYLSVGLNSGISESDFKRKNLNLVVVLDISGSMDSSFDKYYYDSVTGQMLLKDGFSEEDVEEEVETKMDLANKSLVALIDELKPEDRLGLVLYESSAYLAKPLNLISETDISKTKEHILEIESRGGTNMSSGMELGIEQYDNYLNIDSSEYENRIIFLTDAMPNLGNSSEDGLVSLSQKAAEKGIYSTFIGIGVDFNTELINEMTKIQGANYYSVHSEKEFKTRLADEFEFMVTPLVFDLKLTLESDDFEIEKVYGSPEADKASGEIMKVNTLFPSAKVDGRTKGGIVLLKLRKTGEGSDISLKTSYLNREKEEGGSEANFQLNKNPHYYNNGVRKGIVLSRYVNLMKNWMIDERENYEENNPQPVVYNVNYEDGITLPPPMPYELGEWERTSISLSQNEHYADMFSEFLNYYNSEVEALNDPEMEQESQLMEDIISTLSGNN